MKAPTRFVLIVVQLAVVSAACLWLVSRGWGLAALMLAAAAIFILLESSAHGARPAEPSRPTADARSGAPPAAPGPLAPDVEQVLAWCRSALVERVPARGPFPPLAEVLWPESRPLLGLSMHVTVAPFERADAGRDDERTLQIEIEAPDGASLRTDIDLGTATEVVARIDAGERTAWVTRVLERAASELWREDGEAGEEDPDGWSLTGHDAFEGSSYPMGRFPNAEKAREYALARLREMDLASRGNDGGQVRGGIQDRIYLIYHREGRSERIFPPTHPMPIHLAERSIAPERVVLRHADARAAIDFFARSTWCVVTRVETWILRETGGSLETGLERASDLDGPRRTYHLPVGHADSRHIVHDSAAMAHQDITRAYEGWRKRRGAEDTDVCFEITAQDEIPVRG